jgi:2-aminobenzoate-CoA ligase
MNPLKESPLMELAREGSAKNPLNFPPPGAEKALWPGEGVPEEWKDLKKYFPPREYWPDFIWDFRVCPELRLIPYEFNLGELAVDRNAKRFPDRPAIYYEDKKITWGELEVAVNKAGNALLALGVGHNDRVGLYMPNRPEWLIVNFAIWKIGGIPVLINHLFRADNVKYMANDSGAKVIVADGETVDELLKVRDNLSTVQNVIVLDVDRPGTIRYEDFVNSQSSKLEPARTTRYHVARLIYTSGTTGRPKGAIRTADQVIAANVCHGGYILGLTPKDVCGGHPYFTFAFGSVNFTFYPWYFGAATSIIKRFVPEKQWELVEKHRITQLYVVPTALKQMLMVENVEEKYDISSLRLVQSAADILPAAIIREWRRRFPDVELIDSLGSSELQYWLSTRPGWPEEKIGSIGYSVPGMECAIMREDGTFAPPNEEGELVTRGIWGNLYWNRPEEQAKSVIKGWNRMGLYALMDPDGCFWLKGRTASIIKYSGYTIVGQEVAARLLEHPAVKDAAVVGSYDPLRGQIVKALVILNEGYKPTSELAEELRQFVKEKLEFYKVPRIVEFVQELPRTVTGKIDLVALQQMELRTQERSKSPSS